MAIWISSIALPDFPRRPFFFARFLLVCAYVMATENNPVVRLAVVRSPYYGIEGPPAWMQPMITEMNLAEKTNAEKTKAENIAKGREVMKEIAKIAKVIADNARDKDKKPQKKSDPALAMIDIFQCFNMASRLAKAYKGEFGPTYGAEYGKMILQKSIEEYTLVQTSNS